MPDLNIHNEGSYYVDIPLVVSTAFSITGMSFTGIITNNGGNFQGIGREVDFRAEVLAPGDVVIGSDNVNGQNAFMHDVAPFSTTTVNLDFAGVTLIAGNAYNVRLFVGADANFVGNNAGFDDLVIDGNLIPEPSVGALGVLASLLLLGRRRFS